MALTQTQVLPAQFIQDVGTDYAKQLTAATAAPLPTAQFAPSVAAQTGLQTTATGLATPEQPFGGGGGTYTKYANIKSVNDRAKTQNEALNNAIKNTQGNIEWLKNNTTDESFLLMSTEDQYNFLKNKTEKS